MGTLQPSAAPSSWSSRISNYTSSITPGTWFGLGVLAIAGYSWWSTHKLKAEFDVLKTAQSSTKLNGQQKQEVSAIVQAAQPTGLNEQAKQEMLIIMQAKLDNIPALQGIDLHQMNNHITSLNTFKTQQEEAERKKKQAASSKKQGTLRTQIQSLSALIPTLQGQIRTLQEKNTDLSSQINTLQHNQLQQIELAKTAVNAAEKALEMAKITQQDLVTIQQKVVILDQSLQQLTAARTLTSDKLAEPH